MTGNVYSFFVILLHCAKHLFHSFGISSKCWLLFIACNEWFEFKKLIGHCVRSYNDKEWSIAKEEDEKKSNSTLISSRFKAIIKERKNYMDWRVQGMSAVFFACAMFASFAFQAQLFMTKTEQFIHCFIQWANSTDFLFVCLLHIVRTFLLYVRSKDSTI